MKRALLVIDMINDFLDKGAVLEVPMGREIIPNIIKHINQSKKGKAPIDRKDLIFINDSHKDNDIEFKHWPKHAIWGMQGANLYGKLFKDLSHHSYIIRKQTYSGFLNTGLDNLLKSRNINKLYITGILTNICVFVTAVEAQMQGYEVIIYRDSVAALTQEENDRALEQLEKVFKVKIL